MGQVDVEDGGVERRKVSVSVGVNAGRLMIAGSGKVAGRGRM